jgi:regulatory protein SWI5
MLSNPPSSSNIHSRQRLHRRQNSTPTAFEAVKIAPLPNFRQQQQQQQQQQQRQRSSAMSHRRGMTVDTGRLHVQLQQQKQPTSSPTRQDFSTVSTTTNRPGLSTTPQHVLRETQQQRILARPGPSQLNNHNNINQDNTPRHMLAHSRNNSVSSVSSASSIRTRGHSRNSSINHFGIDENSFLMSPHGTPQSQRFMDPMSCQGQFDDMGIPFDPYTNAMNLMMKKNQASYEAQDFELYAPNSTLSTPTFLTFAEAEQVTQQGWISEGEASTSRRTSRRISNGIVDRVAKFEHIAQSTALGSLSRPNTPPGENATSTATTPLSVRDVGY